MKPPLLSATDISVTFGSGDARVRAVRDISLSVGDGESVGIVGESGSGKSTLARVLVGLESPEAGTVALRGRPIFSGSQAYPGASRREVQMVFQDPYTSLNPRMTALATVSEAVRFRRRCPRAEADGLALELLGNMGIGAQDARKKPRQLSGGQRQRVSVARALAVEPSVLVADEPTSAIDQSAQAQLLNLFNGLLRRGLAIVLISHSLAVIRYLSSRVYVMRDGAFVEHGPTERVFTDPQHEYTRMLIASIPSKALRAPEAGALAASRVP
ncbi:MAG: ABC transporter ATP-binding protein [Alphaproteobacteria bacterium]|nr:ABC transporter ATP-binding protein [Alphaproteobacteria bacterium]